ncbi:metal-dependent transcriptional regulator [Nocardioides sp. B-3]|uniref:metal-dependent transcriptional regulator n=1 Tax=Nocardioides sp. B-3 TaxID=2895565 RepID=UPI0021536977|nr:metal-dependent transcriptional regulator [Nocardioides sp. B-3]UUZ58450.1 metal-dependent transcriptional regulator [Nocardioides sp. B-3]
MSGTQTQSKALSCCAIEHTETVENYLKAIFALAAEGQSAGTSEIAERLAVAPPSVSTMIRRLRDCELIEQATWGQVRLTAHGRIHAQRIVRRHRLLETFLHRVLGLSWDKVHAEAEVLEHRLSEQLEDLIDVSLGFPKRDPHGDPIPAKTGEHCESAESPLADARVGDRFMVERVSDRNSAALRSLGLLGIGPGAELHIEERSALGSMYVRSRGRGHVLSSTLVGIIRGHVVVAADEIRMPS